VVWLDDDVKAERGSVSAGGEVDDGPLPASVDINYQRHQAASCVQGPAATAL